MQQYKGSTLLVRTNITDTHVFQTYIAEQLVYESNCLCEAPPHLSETKIFDFQTSVWAEGRLKEWKSQGSLG